MDTPRYQRINVRLAVTYIQAFKLKWFYHFGYSKVNLSNYSTRPKRFRISSRQQALFAAGLERQLLRTDLSKLIRDKLRQAQAKLWQVIDTAAQTNNAELWSFKHDEYQIEPFGQRTGDKTESNAAQLWSTVYLAIPPPLSVNGESK